MNVSLTRYGCHKMCFFGDSAFRKCKYLEDGLRSNSSIAYAGLTALQLRQKLQRKRIFSSEIMNVVFAQLFNAF